MRPTTGKRLYVYRPFSHSGLLTQPVRYPLPTIDFPSSRVRVLYFLMLVSPDWEKGGRMSVNKSTFVQFQCICGAPKRPAVPRVERGLCGLVLTAESSRPGEGRPGLWSWGRGLPEPCDYDLVSSNVSLEANSPGAQNRSLALGSFLPSSASLNFPTNLRSLEGLQGCVHGSECRPISGASS